MVLGATGYVGGETLRLLSQHPVFELEAAVARSAVGRSIGQTFPHLAGTYAGTQFASLDSVQLDSREQVVLFSCLPHGKSAGMLDTLMARAEAGQSQYHLVDLSADFRHRSAGEFERIYGEFHGAPGRIAQFDCALPELESARPARHMSHPGCFTTATTLACAPIAKAEIGDGEFFVSAITGSTGSGRDASAGTHHPERHGNLSAYKPLVHRHAPEMEMLLGALAAEKPKVQFVPHSGPFARGIHVTVHSRLRDPMQQSELAWLYRDFYRDSPFVTVKDTPPRLKDVVGSNGCHLFVTSQGRNVVVPFGD